MSIDKTYYDYDYKYYESMSQEKPKPKTAKQVQDLMARFGFKTKVRGADAQETAPHKVSAEEIQKIAMNDLKQ